MAVKDIKDPVDLPIPKIRITLDIPRAVKGLVFEVPIAPPVIQLVDKKKYLHGKYPMPGKYYLCSCGFKTEELNEFRTHLMRKSHLEKGKHFSAGKIDD